MAGSCFLTQGDEVSLSAPCLLMEEDRGRVRQRIFDATPRTVSTPRYLPNSRGLRPSRWPNRLHFVPSDDRSHNYDAIAHESRLTRRLCPAVY
jgi:hypothetical protein